MTWRDVLDTKITGATTQKMAATAMELGYKWFLHNDRIYAVGRNGWADTGLTVDDIK